jgi:mono/diheme cytochrome c family protein
VSAGRALFSKNCTTCHGKDGEGVDAPSLNDKRFLSTTSDDTIFSVISSGVPGTEMPAWNQAHGGPFTDQDVRQLVAFIRAWEPEAPDRRATPQVGDPARGAEIVSSICSACHGENGKGSDRAPALNDPERLKQFDDAWYRDTITQGRPAKGMPTWGTVLSPAQITDLIALIDTWREAPPAPPTPTPGPAATLTPTATPVPTAAITTTVEIARPSNPGGPGAAVNLTGDPKAGAKIYVDSCLQCHGDEGKGDVNNPGSTDGSVPPLNPIDSTLVDQDPKVFATNLDLFIEHGSTPEGTNPQLKMPAWGDDKKLTAQQIADVIAYVMSLNAGK